MNSVVKTNRYRVLILCAVIVAGGGLSGWLTPPPAEARPQYKTAFQDLYLKRGVRVSCNLCHQKGEKSKKVVNHYGKDLAEALGESKVKDRSRIQDALREIENNSCTGRRSYIERMRAGFAPCPHRFDPASQHRHRSVIDRFLAAPEDR